MKIFDLVFNSDWQTKIFILVSIILLFLIQLSIFKIKRLKILFFISLHVGFGVLLSVVTIYNPFAHLIIYVFPSFILSCLIRIITYKKVTDNKEMKLIFNFTSSNKKIEIYRNGILLWIPCS